MAGLLDVYQRRADALAKGINDLERGIVTSFDFEGASYSTANRDALNLLYDLNLYRAAREGIVAGAQQYTLLGRTFIKANLATIEAQIKRLEDLAVKIGRGGMRVRFGVLT